MSLVNKYIHALRKLEKSENAYKTYMEQNNGWCCLGLTNTHYKASQAADKAHNALIKAKGK